MLIAGWLTGSNVMGQHPVVAPNRHIRTATLAAFLIVAGAARAAGEPPQPEPDASAAQAARDAPPPQALGSGAPQEFPADPRKITLEVLPNGTRLYHMNGQGMEAVTAQIGPDGKLTYRCTDQVEHAVDADVPANAHEQ